jgi:ATP-dependent DNA helicase RecG
MPTPAATPLNQLPGLDSRYLKQLEKEGLATAQDVLAWFPFRHEDRRRQDHLGFAPGPVPVCHHVVVTKASTRYFGGRGRGAFEAQVQPAGGSILGDRLTLRWWNMPFMSRTIVEGMELFIHGRIKEYKGRLSIDHPEYEILKEGDDEAAGIHTGRITPVYRLRGGVTQKALRMAVWTALQHFSGELAADLLPAPSPQGEFAGWSASRALRALHFPEEQAELDQARRYLGLEEFYTYQLRVVHRRRRAIDAGGQIHDGSGELAGQLEAALPFSLTPAQQRCLDEIRRDMASPAPMNRLLHGDVGSGKTIVAFFAILQAIESGAQAALMAPTQILAEQHYDNARKWLAPLGLEIALLTGSRKEIQSAPLFGNTRPQLLIGTHALLHERDLMPDLGLVVIDEQHKFGVAQRARLIQKGRTPDVLVMTATPIPRTLTLTVYGDLDVSTIDQRPKERGKIITKVRPASKQAEATAFLVSQLEEGRQAFLVYPLIDESEKLDAAAAKKGHTEWQKRLPHFSVGLLHGKMAPDQKDLAMRDFRALKHEALVATTVIEVGVDVPNATVMYLHNAERFGLAQLHQLRGRIGRGSHTSYCVLFVADDDEDARQRLAILEETSDGFKIAEEDLKRRGPGDMLGRAQSGQGALRFAELLADTRLVRLARQLAERTLDQDPQLADPRFAAVRATLLEIERPQAMMQ